MTSVTPASVAYVATQVRRLLTSHILSIDGSSHRFFGQVRFGLSSASIFCRTDKETDSETFYTSLLELFEDPEEQDETKDLLSWWNRQVFPSFSNVTRLAPTNSVLSKMKAKRAALKAIDSNVQSTGPGTSRE
jgi:hypothetical protein